MVNDVNLIGRLGKDPELKETVAGMKVATVSLATTKKVSGREDVQWHHLVAFGKTAEIMAKYCRKGKLCYVRGEIRYESWEKDGQTKYMTKIVVDQIRSLEWSDSSRDENEKTDMHALDDVNF